MSLHKDGKCQFGFTSEYAHRAEERFGVMQRHLERWVLPDQPAVRALQILIPASELRDLSIPDSKGVTWLQSPPADTVGTISLLICKPEVELDISADSNSGRVIGRLPTLTRTAWITYAFTHPDEQLRSIIDAEKRKLASVPGHSSDRNGSRAAVWDSRTDHDRKVLELACS